ncbi:MAG: galactokinase family protein [Bacilli bacterium]|jgi:galactokinase
MLNPSDKSISEFERIFENEPTHYFEVGGRLELVGNHTDHNRGKCLVACCSLGLFATARKSPDNIIHIVSIGFGEIYLDLDNLNGRREEFNTSKGMIRGVAAKFVLEKLAIGGFDAYIESTIFPGAGVSSSAAFEVLIAKIFEALYDNKPISPLKMAHIAHYAETEYFGKPCGLLDQIGVAYGGVNYLDFENLEEPIVAKLDYDFPFHIYLVHTGTSHANLTHLYKEIKADMLHVADRVFHKKDLRDVSKDEFFRGITFPTDGVSEFQKLRAQHYIDENDRVDQARDAVMQHDAVGFLTAVRQSGFSSSSFLRNTIHGHYETSPQRGLDLANSVLTEGACRIHGGGFAGTIICFVKDHEVEPFVRLMVDAFGEDHVVKVEIRNQGAASLCLTAPSK